MWQGTSDAFKEALRPFIETTPASMVREGVDSEALVEE